MGIDYRSRKKDVAKIKNKLIHSRKGGARIFKSMRRFLRRMQFKKKVFETKDELKEALKKYLYESEYTKEIINTYGTINLWNVSRITDMSYLFLDFVDTNRDDEIDWSKLNINSWDVSNVTNMVGMFNKLAKFNSPLDGWDVSNVKNMSSMFCGCTEFNQPLEDWNLLSIENMSGMFLDAKKFNCPLNGWQSNSRVYRSTLAKVKDMSFMFQGASSFNQSLSKWNVSNVTDMTYMFEAASSFNQSLLKWNVSNVTYMTYMFEGASQFNQSLAGWNVRNVTDMAGMFRGTESFNQPLDTWAVLNVTSMRSMFEDAKAFNCSVNLWHYHIVSDHYKIGKLKNVNSMFKNAKKFSHPISWIGAQNEIDDMTDMFKNASEFPYNKQPCKVYVDTHTDGMFADEKRSPPLQLDEKLSEYKAQNFNKPDDNFLKTVCSLFPDYINPMLSSYERNGDNIKVWTPDKICKAYNIQVKSTPIKFELLDEEPIENTGEDFIEGAQTSPVEEEIIHDNEEIQTMNDLDEDEDEDDDTQVLNPMIPASVLRKRKRAI